MKTIKKCTNCGGTGLITRVASNKHSLPLMIVCPVCGGRGNEEIGKDEEEDDTE